MKSMMMMASGCAGKRDHIRAASRLVLKRCRRRYADIAAGADVDRGHRLGLVEDQGSRPDLASNPSDLNPRPHGDRTGVALAGVVIGAPEMFLVYEFGDSRMRIESASSIRMREVLDKVAQHRVPIDLNLVEVAAHVENDDLRASPGAWTG